MNLPGGAFGRTNPLRTFRRQLSAFSALLEELYSIEDIDAFPAEAFHAIKKILPFDSTIYCELGPKWQLHRTFSETAENTSALCRFTPIFNIYLPEHPFLKHFFQFPRGGIYKISDVSTRSSYHRLGLYHEIYKKLHIEYQIAFELPTDYAIVGCCFNRERRDFGEKERSFLALIRPHFLRAHHHLTLTRRFLQSLTLLRSAARTETRGFILVAPNGEIECANPRAQDWLVEYFGALVCKKGLLPDSLKKWIEQSQTQTDVSAAFVVEKLRRTLTVLNDT